MLKINDPKVLEWNARTEQKYRSRAIDALQAESHEPANELLDFLANAGRKFECEAPPSIAPHVIRGLRGVFEVVGKELKGIHSHAKRLVDSINDGCRSTQQTLLHELEKKGVSREQLDAVLSALSEVAEAQSRTTLPRGKTGNSPKIQSEWVLQIWPQLDTAGLSQRASSRVISKLLHDSDDQAETIYQAIRNSMIR